MSEVSTKPYLLRAIYEWCVDQGHTPHIVVEVDRHAIVPAAYVRDGQIVLNIAPHSCNQLQMGNEFISFQARFSGVVEHLVVPVANVAAIYARENGQGMAFEVQLPADEEEGVADLASPALPVPEVDDDAGPEPAPPRPAGRGGHLKRVK